MMTFGTHPAGRATTLAAGLLISMALLACSEREPLSAAASALGKLAPASPPSTAPTPAPGNTQAVPRKCRRGTGIEYTNGPCPSGTREEPITAGSVSVLPAPPAAKSSPAVGSAAATAGTAGAAPANATSQTPLLRQLAGADGSGPSLQEQRVDRAVGR